MHNNEKKPDSHIAYGAAMDGLSAVTSSVSVVGRYWWNVQMHLLQKIGIMPVFRTHWWLFFVVGFLLLAFVPPIGIAFVISAFCAGAMDPESNNDFIVPLRREDLETDHAAEVDGKERLVMGCFSKKASEAKVQGSEAGQLARDLLHGEFMLTSFYDDGKFSQPIGFFQDPYVVGFLHGYIVAMADVCSARRGRHWTQKEATEFILSGMEAAVGSKQMVEFIEEPRKCKDNQDYKDAYLAANTCIKAIFATPALSDDNHLVVEAKNLIEERKSFLAEFFPNPRRGDLLAWAIQEISIKKHIKSTYLADC